MKKNRRKTNRYEKKYETQKKIVLRQLDEIEKLKSSIFELEIDSEKRTELIDSITDIRTELYEVIDDLSERREEYTRLIEDLRQMKMVMNQTVFKGKWRLIKLLLR
jgi:flagellar biosynthesis/type III secretory pathway chaperone